jgi:hypothetical protein
VQYRDDSQRISGGLVHDQIGIEAPELQRTVGQVVTRWPTPGRDASGSKAEYNA